MFRYVRRSLHESVWYGRWFIGYTWINTVAFYAAGCCHLRRTACLPLRGWCAWLHTKGFLLWLWRSVPSFLLSFQFLTVETKSNSLQKRLLRPTLSQAWRSNLINFGGQPFVGNTSLYAVYHGESGFASAFSVFFIFRRHRDWICCFILKYNATCTQWWMK